MVAYTYSTLVTALLAFTENNSDEYLAQLPNIILNGQEQVIRDLDLEIFKQTYEGSFTSGSNYVNKPDGILVFSSFYYIDPAQGGQHIFLDPRSYDFCIMYAGGIGFTGAPKFYDEGFSDTQALVSPAPNSAYAYRIRALRRPNYISESQEENWVSRYAGDLLLYSCLTGSEKFTMALQQGKPQEWQAEYDLRLPQARIELAQIARMEYSPSKSNAEAR